MRRLEILLTELLAIHLYLGQGGTLERWYELNEQDRADAREVVRKANFPRQFYPPKGDA